MPGSHSTQTTADGIHTPVAFEYANAAARTSATGFQSFDLYKVAVDLDTGNLFYLSQVSPPVWTSFAGASLTLTGAAPEDVDAAAAAVGSSGDAARADHKHDISTGTPVAVGSANAEGTANSMARSDHVHSHGNQAGGALHANATTGTAGFMSSADKTKLDGLPSTIVFGTEYQYAESNGLTSTTTTNPSWTVKTTLTTGAVPSGTYLLTWSAEVSNNYAPGNVQLWDSTGSTQLDLLEGYENRGNDHFIKAAGLAEVTFSGVRTFQIRFNSVSFGTNNIQRARVAIWRVA